MLMTVLGVVGLKQTPCKLSISCLPGPQTVCSSAILGKPTQGCSVAAPSAASVAATVKSWHSGQTVAVGMAGGRYHSGRPC